jgi:tRNA A-37 threonylcarbamoyl transferase component Bud32
MIEEDIVSIFEEQLPTLILDFTNKNLVHYDIAFRNFTLDEEKKLHLVDYSSIEEFSHFCEIDSNLFVYLEADFEHLQNTHLVNRGKELILILKKIIKIN